ncbi:GNAT family N-acetyltransferase [Kibdelosporangium philippinense]|uniref:GNAT family N-acetyltransferase n=1 Tax=Kibdelosporangium philippinense TaxID=211113 RepID=A0ABS8Z7B1_9PSEU|nr:GNAT family N-acetyltransferase [Kibdelosporangium philippinense]MCE7002463.1 GNAT family N-acetyltransferase [Kibdelosporangium philippinense]
MNPLDNPIWASLTGPHAHFAVRQGLILRYPEDVAVFAGIPDNPDDTVWQDIAEIAGPGGQFVLTGSLTEPPQGWEVVDEIAGVQLVDDGVVTQPDEEAILLGPADVPEMLDLVERTKPGPFRKRTIELGTYLGIRRGGALVAMAGERMRPPGWTEISAVCTDPAFRGQGLAARLVLAVADGIKSRGDKPFLHTGADNTNAIRLYESLGFRLRRRTSFVLTRVSDVHPFRGTRIVPPQVAPSGHGA